MAHTDLRHSDAVALLRELSGPHGIHASAAHTTNYRAIFTRDAVMAGIAGAAAGDATVVEGLVRTLEGLRTTQGEQGQIASNVEWHGSDAPAVSFGSLAPRLDGATWYLVGVGIAGRLGAIDPARFAPSVARTVALLDALEYNGRHLLYVPAGGNWADEYIFDGYILYDQVLRVWGLRLVGTLFGEPRWTEKADQISRTISTRFAPPHRDGRHPPAALAPARVYEMFDCAAIALLTLSGAAETMAGIALDWIDDTFLRAGRLVPAFDPVIDEGHPEWPALRRYHLHAFRNAPHEYHNGGIWPIWLGWLGVALVRAGRRDALARLTSNVDRFLVAHPTYDFEEFAHGLSTAPMGTPRMAYSASGLLLLAHATDPSLQELLTP
jgi:GH15 family glucan-1,4-alpha-glucosidase